MDIKKDLFSALNPKKMPPEYNAALKNNDLKTALKIAVGHFRSRPVSAFLSDLKERDFDLETAENAVKGNITVVNISYQFPNGEIDFLFDPTRRTGVFNAEWQWQINRMYFWNDMAVAYLRSGDEKFAAAFDRQIKSWVTNVKCPEVWNDVGTAWRTIETGLRLMGSWQIAFEVFRKSPSVSDETLAMMLGSMHEQAWHALEHRTKGNWLMMEINGAFSFAALFPEFSSSSDMQKQTAAILGEELRKQVLPDGMHNELSPDYHSVVFQCATMLFTVASQQKCTDALPADFADNLEKMANTYLNLMTPDFTMPRTNDCYTMEVIPRMKIAHNLFPDRKDFIWAASARKEGLAPHGRTASRFLPYAGFVAMRSSWENDASYLCFDVGPLGVAHVHYDKLNINIYKGGEELLFDDGGGQYEVSQFRKYGISGYDHNIVLVDGNAQTRKTPGKAEKAIDADFFSDERFDYAYGIYDDTFGENMLKTATHKREVLFVKPDFFVVADTLQSADGNPHDYTMLLHLDTLNVKISANSAHGILSGQYDLYILQLADNTAISVESGETSPVSGWYVGRNDKDLHKASTVKITSVQQKDFKFTTLFFPFKKGTPPPTAKAPGSGKWEIIFNGKSYKLDLNDLKSNL